MKKLLVCFIAIAISIGFGLTPVMAQNADDPHNQVDPPNWSPQMYVDPGGIGDLLLFSLYDVRPVDGRGDLWENYIAIENTSGKWTAFHLRFRAWKKSIEVFDHVILLSPYDVFWMTLKRASEPGLTTYPCDSCTGGYEPYEVGDVLMNSRDMETLYNSALIYKNINTVQWLDKFQDSLLVFNGFYEENDDTRAPKSELQAGYIEAIGLWQLSIPASVDPTGTEDSHLLTDVVNDVHPDPGVLEGTINVLDALDALFYRFFTPLGHLEAIRTVSVPNPPVVGDPALYACDDPLTYTGCYSRYPVDATFQHIDSAWPDFYPRNLPAPGVARAGLWDLIKIERLTRSLFGNPPLVFVDEGKATRLGLDCGNVLAGNVTFGDPQDGKYQMENFIAVKNFRTDWFPLDTGLPAGNPWNHDYYNNCQQAPASPYTWRHRDGFAGGGIFYPASINDWYYEVGDILTGGSPKTYLWYYVNPSPTTGVGPMLVDGDDVKGTNFNDANFPTDPEDFVNDGTYYNPMVANYGLTRPFPIPASAGETLWAFVHYYNDIWSLDDLEAALAKFEIWYTHLRTRISDLQKGNLDTDVVMTYPTKHDHFFFTDWPFMWQPWNTTIPCPSPFPNAVTTPIPHPVTDVGPYWANLLDYRGDKTAEVNQTTYYGKKSIEELLVYYDDDDTRREAEMVLANTKYNHTDMTFAEWFQAKWLNGRIYIDSYIWNNDQLSPTPSKKPPAPGSPWKPTIEGAKWLPHEVNIVRAGDYNGVWPPAAPSINDGNWLLALAKGLTFGKGHFMFTPSYLYLGQRVLWEYGVPNMVAWCDPTDHAEFCHDIYYGSSYLLPPIGIVELLHDFGANQPVGQNFVTRSAMAEWHYIQYWLGLTPKGNGG